VAAGQERLHDIVRPRDIAVKMDWFRNRAPVTCSVDKEQQGEQMRSTTRVAVLVVGMALAFGQASFVDAQPFDHLKCHKVKDPHKMKGTFDPAPALQPAFADQGCKIVRAKFFCAPVEKNNVQVNPPPAFPALGGQDLTNDFTCYKIKCPTQPPDTVVTDQFASRTLTKMKAQLLCTPTYKGVVTTTTSTTTTTTPTPCLNQTAPMCNGPCPDPLDTCVSVVGATTCECRHPCGIDATGQCSGDCSVPTDVCTQLADGTCRASAVAYVRRISSVTTTSLVFRANVTRTFLAVIRST